MLRACKPVYSSMVAATLIIAAPAFAQSERARGFRLETPFASDRGQVAGASRPLFAVGGGFYAATVLTEDGAKSSAPGFSGGFEFRPTDNLSLIAEGTWTGGYEVYPGFQHEYFAHFEGKLRWVLTNRWRHAPYLNLGVARIWDRDTVPTFDPAFRDQRSVHTYFLTGFGWSFELGDGFEIRPEVQLYVRGIGSALMRTGVSVWYAF